MLSCHNWEKKKVQRTIKFVFFHTKKRKKETQSSTKEEKRGNKRFQWFNIISMNKKALFSIFVRSLLDDVWIFWAYTWICECWESFLCQYIFLWFIHKCYLYTCCMRATHDEKIGEIEITMAKRMEKQII